MTGLNLLLTLDCSLNCEYCFAQSLREGKGRHSLSLAELETIVSTLDPARDAIRLMGGEPTLHPQYAQILESLKEQGFWVIVFTNGLQPVLNQTAPCLPDEILLNLNDWEFYSHAQQAAIHGNLEALGSRIGLGFTITQPDFDLSQHSWLIQQYRLRPVIRLGLAQPVVGGHNHYLPDGDLANAHHAVAGWVAKLAREQIRVNLDCGFMRCHFSESEIEALVRAGTVLNFHCEPTVDIGPGLRVWRCFAFSGGAGISWDVWQQSRDAARTFLDRG